MKTIAFAAAVALSACAHAPSAPAPIDCSKADEYLDAALRRAMETHDARVYERAMREYQECIRKNRVYANPKKPQVS